MNYSARAWSFSAILFLCVSPAWSSPQSNPRLSHKTETTGSTSSPVNAGHSSISSHDHQKPSIDSTAQNIQAQTTIFPSIQPAAVTLQHGVLTVSAHNSDLSQILQQVAQSGGMTIDGSVQSVKVFGNYGPGNSRDVLTELLRGLEYNFVMVGQTNQGAPKELLLTPRTGSVAPLPPASSASTRSQALNSDGSIADGDHPGPGAIVNVPPPPPDDAQERAQQHLQRLEQMHNPLQPTTPPQ